jgi:hypothetical protein
MMGDGLSDLDRGSDEMKAAVIGMSLVPGLRGFPWLATVREGQAGSVISVKVLRVQKVLFDCPLADGLLPGWPI